MDNAYTQFGHTDYDDYMIRSTRVCDDDESVDTRPWQDEHDYAELDH